MQEKSSRDESHIMSQDANKPADFNTTYPVPLNELARLQALQELRILDTPPEDIFDAAVRQAAHACNAPIAMISLIDRDRQWFKARIGIAAQETPRYMAFSAHAILDQQLFEVPDAHIDERFVNNALVTGEPGIRFYAGMPLISADGMGLGTLCVIDHEPRQLDARQRESLQDLARLVTALLESRKTAAESTQLGLILNEAFDEIIVLYPGSQHVQYANARALENLGYRLREMQQMSLPCVGADYPLSELQKLCRNAAGGDLAPLSFEAVHVRKDGSTYPVEVRATVSSSLVSPQVILLANDISERKLSEERLGDLATYDSVTQLTNRRSFETRLVRAMQSVRCSGKSLALVMIEIDRLTDIRHAYGKELADNVLADFAARLKGCTRAHDVVAHLGGDEFVILAESVDDVNAMPSLAARIHRKMEPYFLWEQCQIPLSASIGAVYFSGGTECADALLARGADAVNITVLNGIRQQILPLPGLSASSGKGMRPMPAYAAAVSGR